MKNKCFLLIFNKAAYHAPIAAYHAPVVAAPLAGKFYKLIKGSY